MLRAALGAHAEPLSPISSVVAFRLIPIPVGCIVLACALAATLVGAPTAGAGTSGGLKRPFDVPAGVAETTLRIFAEQAGGQFIFSAAKVEGVHTHAVKGRLGARQALEVMIANTVLRVVEDENTRALTVDRVRPQSAPPERDAPDVRPENRPAAPTDPRTP